MAFTSLAKTTSLDNSLKFAEILQRTLDQQLLAHTTTSWMEANAGQVIYNGGKTVKIASINMSGLKDYDRVNGYPQGSVEMAYQTLTMTQDRGNKFRLDAIDVDETGFLANAAVVAGEFQRTKVAPEIDAYRYSKLFNKIKTANSITTASAALSTANIIEELSKAINGIYDKVGFQPLVITMSYNTLNILENSEKIEKKMSVDTFGGNINLKVKTFDGIPIIAVPSSLFKSDYTFYKGNEVVSGGDSVSPANNGFAASPTANNIDWIITPATAPIAVSKTDFIKIVSPDINQFANAWDINYRKFHDIWLTDEKAKACTVRFKS